LHEFFIQCFQHLFLFHSYLHTSSFSINLVCIEIKITTLFLTVGQLAGFKWRSKFGRPSKVPELGDVDPTGTYCPLPEEWLSKKYGNLPIKHL